MTVHDAPNLPHLRRAVLDITNAQRHAAGRHHDLTLDPGLNESAQHVARRKARARILRHSRFWFKVLERLGRHRYTHEGENLADGFHTPAEVCLAWRNSAEHWANAGNDQMRHLGVGVAIDEAGVWWWTEHFASER